MTRLYRKTIVDGQTLRTGTATTELEARTIADQALNHCKPHSMAKLKSGTPKAGKRWSASKEAIMSFGKGALLWLIGIPLPIILLLALFWR